MYEELLSIVTFFILFNQIYPVNHGVSAEECLKLRYSDEALNHHEATSPLGPASSAFASSLTCSTSSASSGCCPSVFANSRGN